MVVIGVDADIAGDGQCFPDDILGRQIGIFEQRTRGCLSIGATRANGDDAVLLVKAL